MESKKPTSNEAENGNKSKPLLTSRPFKFRFWDDKDGIIFETDVPEMIYFDLKKINSNRKEDGIWQEKIYLSLGIHHLPLMQFTGFKDYDGKEIFEGDIISFTSVRDSTQKKKFEIYFDKDCGSWYCKNGSELCNILVEQNNDDWKRSQNWTIKDNQYIRVIGNIYENPELLDVWAVA